MYIRDHWRMESELSLVCILRIYIEGYLHISPEVWERLLRDRMDYESSQKLAAQVSGLHLKTDDMLRGFSIVFSNTYGWQLDEELRIFLSLYTSDLRWGLSTHQTTGRYWSSPSITQFVCPIRVQMFGHLLLDTYSGTPWTKQAAISSWSSRVLLKIDDMMWGPGVSTLVSNAYGWYLDNKLRIFLVCMPQFSIEGYLHMSLGVAND